MIDAVAVALLLATKLYLPCIRHYDVEVDAKMVACQITTSASQHLLISVFYRPLNAGEAFLESFKNFLDVTSNTGVTDVVITAISTFLVWTGPLARQPLLII